MLKSLTLELDGFHLALHPRMRMMIPFVVQGLDISFAEFYLAHLSTSGKDWFCTKQTLPEGAQKLNLCPLTVYITAWYAIARRDYPSAIRTFRQIIAQFPFEIEAYRRLARLLYGEEQTDEAIKVIKQGLAVDPEAKELYNGLGMFYSGLGRYDEAIAMHQRYVALAPRKPNAHDSLGMSYIDARLSRQSRCQKVAWGGAKRNPRTVAGPRASP